MDAFHELSEIGEVAQATIGELDEIMPEGATVRAAMMIVELEYECEDCGEVHEFCFVHSDLDSTAYQRGLLYEALDSVEVSRSRMAEPDPYHDDDD